MKKKLLSMLSTVVCAGTITGQTVLISPTGDGGFENGATFAANGWTAVNYAATTNSNWFLTSAPVSNGTYSFTPSGTGAAYISNNNGTNWRYNTSAVAGSTHLYRNVTFPAGETNIKLSFRWNTYGETTEWDVLYVYLAPTSRTPVTGTPSSNSSDVSSWTGTGTSTLVGIYYQLAAGSGTTTTVSLPASLAGSTQRLVFTWKNDGGGGSEPPAALDDISLTSSSCGLAPTALNSTTVTSSAANFTWTPGGSETAWDIYRGPQPLTAPTATTVPTATTSAASYSVSGLTQNTAYAIYVRANCGGGVFSPWTAVRNYTTPASCPAPTTVVISAITPTSAVATWTAGGAETNWFVKYSAPTTTVVASGTPSYTMTGLTPSMNYSIQVKGICGAADSSTYTTLKTFMTPCLPPNITATTPGSRCGVGTLTLGVAGDPGSLFQWYAAASGGTAVATGSVYTTPVLNATTNFYVSASNVSTGLRTFGAGASSGTGIAYNFTQGGYGGLKGQYLYTAAELSAAGLTAGNITNMSFEVISAGSTLNGFAVQVGTTTLTAFPTPITILGGLNTVYPAASFVPVVGMNTINFTTPYNWDGVSNIVVSISWSNNNTSNTSSTIKYDATTNYASQTYRKDSETSANMFAFTGASGSGTSTFDRSLDRPMMRFAGNVLCEGTRTVVPATVNSAAVVSLSTPTAVCVNVISTVSVTSTLSNYDSYIWSPTTNLYTDAGATVPYAGGSATVLYYKSATAGTTTYTVNATNSVSGCANVASTSRTTDIPVVNAYATPSVICSGAAVTLSATTNIIAAGNVAIGTATTLTAGNTTEPTAFCNRYTGYRMQAVYTAAELTAAGLRAGNITSIAYNITTLGSAATNPLYTVKCGTTAVSSFTNFEPNTGFTTVFPAATYTHSVGVNVIPFSTPYNWDGVSNLIVEVTHDGVDGSNSSQTYYTTTPGNTIVYSNYNSAAGNPGTMRLNIIFNGQASSQGAGSLTWQWNPGAISGSTTTVNPVNTGTNPAVSSYTVTGTNPGSGCTATAVANVTVNPVPAAPSASNSTQCGLGIPTASVSGGTSYKWYATPTSTTVLQSGASATFTSSINATTTWYVTSFNGTCESVRSALTASVTMPDAVTATASSSMVCPGSTVTLTAVQSGTNNVYSYTWTATPAANSGMPASVTGASVNVAQAAPGTYVYNLLAFDGVCTTTSSVSVTMNNVPIINATATPTMVCSSSTVNLNATTSTISTGTVAIGTGTGLTTTTEELTAFCNRRINYRQQTLYTAAELTAAGLTAGNITSVSYSISSVGDAATNANFTVKCGTVAATAFTNYVATTGFTTVFPAATYTHAVGPNVINFSTPYFWDGVSSLVVEVSHDGADDLYNAQTYYETLTADRTVYGYNNAATGTTSTKRFNTIINGQKMSTGTGSLTWQWDPGAINSSTATVTPVNTGTNPATSSYTITGVDPVSTCSNSAVVSVTVNPVPVVPTAANSTQCGVGTPTASVSGGTNYKWYATPTSTTVLQAGPSATFTTTIGSTATFYVSSYNANCESGRVALTASVTTPDAITATSTSTAVCPGQSFTLTAANTGTNNVYSYTWTANPATGSGMATSVTGATTAVTPATIGSYSYKLTGSDAVCTTTTAITVVLNAPPAISASATPSVICAGATATLTAVTPAIGAGNASIGNGTGLTTTTEELTAFCNRRINYRQQTLYTAAELTAAGLVAGNITSVSYSITTIGDAATNANFTVKCGTVAATAFTDYVATTGFTTVFPAATYTHVTGANTINFSTPYFWDGVSSLVVEVSHDGIDALYNAQTYYETLTVNRTVFGYNSATVGTTSTKRFNTILNGQIMTTSAGSLTWQWNPGAVNSNTMAVSPATGTSSYTVTAIDPATTCSNTAAVTLTINPIPTVTVAASTGSLCSGTTATLTAGGTATYSWMPAGGSASVAVVSPTTSTIYTVTGTSLGCSATQTVSLNVTPTPTVVASATPTVICAGATVSLTASGATTYSWMPNSTGSGTTTATPTVSTTYTVSGTTAGCTNTRTLNVTVNNVPTLTITTTPTAGVLCTTGATATLTATGTSTAYVWSNGANTASTSVAPSATTVYTVTGTNSCGVKTMTTSIAVATTPTIAASSSSTLTCANNPAVLTASATPGVTFSWNTGSSTASITVTPNQTTTYTVTATNACGSAVATVVQNVSPCTGIEEVTGADGISIYPNPASDYVSIAIPANLVSAGTIVEITDALGKVVMKEAITTDVTTLRVAQLEDGVYFFKVITNSQAVKIGKVVKH